MEKFELKNGQVYLDNKKVENLKGYKLVSSTENKEVAELTLVMDVSITQVEP